MAKFLRVGDYSAIPKSRSKKMPVCPECRGEMRYDPVVKKFTCKSCGLTLSQQEVIEIRDKSRDDEETTDEKKKRTHDEYLRWWLSKKD